MTEPEETKRLEEITRLGVLRLYKDSVLQEAVDFVADALDMPMATVTIVLDSSQHFLVSHGLTGWVAEAGGTPREWSFCTHAVESKADFVVSDAARHPATKDNPVVEIEGVRCYAGVPLVTLRGYAIGTLCVAGGKEHEFGDKELAKLREMAKVVMHRIEEMAPKR